VTRIVLRRTMLDGFDGLALVLGTEIGGRVVPSVRGTVKHVRLAMRHGFPER
jgi:hypothetical protein